MSSREAEAASSGLASSFVVMAAVLAACFVAGVFTAWRRTGATASESIRASVVAAAGVALWMTVTYVAAARGQLRFDSTPPTMMLVFAALIALAVGVGVSPVGARLATGLPLAVLVGSQAFRWPLELMLHRAYLAGLMPVQMSYSGLNYDIASGVSASAVAALLASGRVGARTVRAWNLASALLLCNIITIAMLSAPTPFRVFTNEPANVWVTTVPYIWLPTVMVAFAILGHILVFRRLRAFRN